MPTELTIQFSATGTDTGSDGNRVRLEQERIPDVVAAANLYDLSQMVARAMGGLSARTYRRPDCPVEITGKDTAIVRLGILAWPSAMDLPYSLSVGLGRITGRERIDKQMEFDLVVEMTDQVDIGMLFDGTAAWQTEAIDEVGRVVPAPGIEIEGSMLRLERPVFGVLRMSGTVHGYRHVVEMEFGSVDSVRITDIRNQVVAAWQTGDGGTDTATMDLAIPACVADLLQSCPGDGTWMTLGSVTYPDDGMIPVIYYSTCTGKVLEVRHERP